MSQSASSNSPRPTLLRAVNLCRTYDDGQVRALENATLEIAQGDYLAIMGPSGSGKSTMLNLLGALDKPTTGDIFFKDQSLLNHPNLDQFRAHTLGFVFQSFYLLPTLTAIENIQIPMFEGDLSPRQRVAKAKDLLGLVGLGHRANHLPLNLSVGERQRVAIARALANDPQMLLADEPTGNLDSVAGDLVLNLFDRLHQEHKLTLVVITHSLSVSYRAERTIWISDGKIKHQGEPHED